MVKIAYMLVRGSLCPQADFGPELTLGAIAIPGGDPVPYDLTARLTVAEAAAYFGMTKAAINMWYVSGKLEDVKLNRHGHRTYLFGELLKAESDTRNQPSRSHRKQLQAA